MVQWISFSHGLSCCRNAKSNTANAVCLETFNENKSDFREGEETIAKLFTGLVSVCVAKDCYFGLENAAMFSRARSKFFAVRT